MWDVFAKFDSQSHRVFEYIGFMNLGYGLRSTNLRITPYLLQRIFSFKSHLVKILKFFQVLYSWIFVISWNLVFLSQLSLNFREQNVQVSRKKNHESEVIAWTRRHKDEGLSGYAQIVPTNSETYKFFNIHIFLK